MLTGLLLGMVSALQSLRARTGRTLLAGTGIVVGVAAIIVLIGTAEGVQRSIVAEIEGVATNLVFVVPGRIDPSQPFNPVALFGISPLRSEDLTAIAAVPGVERVAAFMVIAGGVQTENRSAPAALVVATTPVWFEIHPTEAAAGRLLREGDGPVCVLGATVADGLFPGGGAVGKRVQIYGHPFEVLGVVKATTEGEHLFGPFSWDNLVYVPLDVMQEVSDSSQLHRIFVQTGPTTPPSEVTPAIRTALRKAHGGSEDFTVFTQQDFTTMTTSVLGTLTALLAGVTAIALIVGGLGVMNVMLMAVSERTREIGLRKTAGATQGDIFWQFLFEAMVQTLIGGAIGVVIALAACWVLRHTTPLQPHVTIGTTVMAVAVCAAVGIVFGLIPAVRAAMKDPVESLRYE
jgi:putative ABC transport system permease protein